MPENPEQAEARKLRELEGKNVAHYSVFLNGWVQTRMERDKTLVTLSSAAIGLLIAILTTVGLNARWHIFLYIVAFVGFAVTIFLSIQIYQKNSELLEQEIRGPDDPGYKKISLKGYDSWSLRAFIIGVTFLALIGIASAIKEVRNPEEQNMNDKKSSNYESSEVLKKSLEGAQNLKPKLPASTESGESGGSQSGSSDAGEGSESGGDSNST